MATHEPHAHAPLPTAETSNDPHLVEHMAKHVRGYLIVGAILIVCTGITVWLSYFNFGSIRNNWIIAMVVATFKVSLVGAIFLHLKGERWTVWRVLFFTFFFVAGLFLLTLLHWSDPIFSTSHTHH